MIVRSGVTVCARFESAKKEQSFSELLYGSPNWVSENKTVNNRFVKVKSMKQGVIGASIRATNNDYATWLACSGTSDSCIPLAASCLARRCYFPYIQAERSPKTLRRAANSQSVLRSGTMAVKLVSSVRVGEHKKSTANAVLGSPNWARTSDIMINSHALYRLSYRGK